VVEWSVSHETRRIVIIGGGFAGASLARALGRRLPQGWEVLLLSDENHFVFTPLLAEVVGASIDPLHVVWAVREMAPVASCRSMPVQAIDLERREVVCVCDSGEEVRERWDHLVIACGMTVKLDLVPGMAEHAWPLKTLGDALALRNHVIQQLEHAEAEPHPERRKQLLSFAIVGGGFTGIELAGAVMDLLVDASRFYKRFSREDIRVSVVEGGPRILAPLPESLSRYADKVLKGMGVQVLTGKTVSEIHAAGITLGDGELVPAATTITAIGNAAQPLLADSPLETERGRLVVTPEMRVKGHENVWALGDCAAVPNAFDGTTSPTLGQFAIRQADQLARNLAAIANGGSAEPFHYHMKGMFAAIGNGRAVGNPFGIRLSGPAAYFMWRAIYLAKMPSISRQLQIAFDWFWDLFFPRDIVEISTLRTGRPVENAANRENSAS